VSTDYEYHALRLISRRRGLPTVFHSDEQGSIVGVDGCSAGWVCFHIDLQSRSTSVAVVSKISELLSASPRPLLVGIDIPIGLPLKGPRACDLAARRLLGKPRSSSVFPAPVRATMVAENYKEACRLSKDAHGKSMSKQAYEIIAKIREVDDLMTPEMQTWVFEVHPEVSFYTLNGRRPLKHSKHGREGKDERLQLLLQHYPAIQAHLGKLKRGQVGEDDLLDAAAAAWTAEMVATGIVPRQFDARGLRMEMVS
jgi:predicted RNase H-like nuclease